MRHRRDDHPRRVFLGLADAAGLFARLQTGLAAHGVESTTANLMANPFGYGGGVAAPPLPVRAARAAFGRRRAASGCAPLRTLVAALAHAWLFAWAVTRHDAFVFGGRVTFARGYDLPLLRLLRQARRLRVLGQRRAPRVPRRQPDGSRPWPRHPRGRGARRAPEGGGAAPGPLVGRGHRPCAVRAPARAAGRPLHRPRPPVCAERRRAGAGARWRAGRAARADSPRREGHGHRSGRSWPACATAARDCATTRSSGCPTRRSCGGSTAAPWSSTSCSAMSRTPGSRPRRRRAGARSSWRVTASTSSPRCCPTRSARRSCTSIRATSRRASPSCWPTPACVTRWRAARQAFVAGRCAPEAVAERLLRVLRGDIPREWVFDPRELRYVRGACLDEARTRSSSARSSTTAGPPRCRSTTSRPCAPRCCTSPAAARWLTPRARPPAPRAPRPAALADARAPPARAAGCRSPRAPCPGGRA